MGGLPGVNLAKLELGFPEFPSLDVSSLGLASIEICMKFGGQKLNSSHFSALQLSSCSTQGRPSAQGSSDPS